MAERGRLHVDVFKAARAPATPSFMRLVIERAGTLPEVAARLPPGKSSVAVRLTTDAELRRLNRSYAGADSVTDVLSFGGSQDHVGDLAISWPMVVRQAQEHGHTELAELGLLCVHGLLHLLGWGHATTSERREMTRITVAALELSDLHLAPGRI